MRKIHVTYDTDRCEWLIYHSKGQGYYSSNSPTNEYSVQREEHLFTLCPIDGVEDALCCLSFVEQQQEDLI